MKYRQILQLRDRLQLINLIDVLERMGGDSELLHEVAGDFLKSYEETFEAVVRAIETENADDLQHNAHALKGAVRNFGAEKVEAAAYRLEMMGQQSQFEGSGAALACLRTTLADLRPEMELLAREQGSV